MESSESRLVFWDRLYDEALEFMDSVRPNLGTFIEVAAQHPLKDGLTPGPEFTARLEAAAELYHLEDNPVKCHIYVPGGKHKQGDVEDKVSLSEAGITYLHERCLIPLNCLHGQEDNLRITHGAGVFNSDDECYVSSFLFKESGYGRFICVCSPGQMMRKALSYLKYGCLPDFHTVSVPHSHHRIPWEACVGIPKMVNIGAAMTRNERDARKASSQE